jgi:probable HAF family extracellular repeat protein
MFMSLDKSARAGRRFAALMLPALLAAVLTACNRGHHPPPPPGGGAAPRYDVIPLGIPDVHGDITRQSIANGGIVAGTSWGGPGGTPRAFLCKGTLEADIGTLGDFARAQGVDRCGRVTGWSGRADGLSHAFLYDGAMHDLGTLGGTESAGNAVNACGKATGWAVTAGGETHAFLYEGKSMRDLGSLGGNSFGMAINAHGQVAGYSYGPGNAWFHAVLYDSRTGAPIRDLGSPAGNSTAVAINDAGQVVGWWRKEEGPVGAFYYEGGVLRDIGTLGGDYAEATDINQKGIAVGNSNLKDGAQRGFVYDGKTMTSIGTLKGSQFSQAVAINAGGLVVGSSSAGPNGEEHAISWTGKDGIADLNERLHGAPAGLVLVTALAVADDGNIAVRTNRGLALLKLRH